MFDPLIGFECPFCFILLAHWLVPTLMAVCFDFSSTIQCFAVYFQKFNILVNKHSNFLALGFLTGVDVRGTLGLLYVTPYIVNRCTTYSWNLWYQHM